MDAGVLVKIGLKTQKLSSSSIARFEVLRMKE